jgi:predicted amidohydrolase
MRWLPARTHDNGLSLIYSNGIGVDDNKIRTGPLSLRTCFRSESTMILDPYGRIPAETWKAGEDMVVADLDASLLKVSTGNRWIKTRRLTVPIGVEQDTRTVRFNKKGV